MPLNAPLVLLRIDADATAAGQHPRHRHPSLALKYIQAAIERDCGDRPPLLDHTLAPTLTGEDLAAQALGYRPRFAIVAAQSWNLATALACAARLRQAGVVTVAVGQQVLHAMRAPVAGWADAYDIALAGDSEAAAPQVVARLMAGTAPALLAAEYAPAPGRLLEIDDPDALPDPRFDAAELAAYPFPFPLRRAPVRRWGYVLTAWGCPRACRHCSAVVRKSATSGLRRRSLTGVADSVAQLADAGAQGILFEDDSLCVDRRRFLALCDTLVRRGLTLPWIANARPDELDGECVAAAAAAGAALIKVGVDCAAPHLIERIAKAKDGGAWIAASQAAFAALDAAGIGSVALFTLGLPGETAADMAASMQLARRLRPDYVQVQIYTPYPDAALWQDLSAAERAGVGSYHYGAPGFTPSAIAAADLPALQRRFYRGFYFAPAFALNHLRRAWRHYLAPASLAGSMRHAAYLLHGAVQPPQRQAEDA